MNRIAKMLVMDDKQKRSDRNGRDWADHDRRRYDHDDDWSRMDPERRGSHRYARNGAEDWHDRERGRDPMKRYDFALQGAMTHKDGTRRSGGITFDLETAKEWTEGMQNEDGSRGPHWTRDQTDQVLAQKGYDCDPTEFFAILNNVYSDYSAVAKKHGVNNIDFYVDLAKAWLCDKDAVKNKAAAYFEYVVKH